MDDSQIPPELPGPSIKYSLTRWDVLRWQLWATLHNRLVLGLWAVVTTFIVIGQLRNSEIVDRSFGFKIAFAIVMICITLAFLCGIQFAVMICFILARKYRGLVGEHELRICAEGLLERTDVNESLHRWAGFHKIVSSGGYLYIYVTDNNVHVVPKRCFPSEREAEQFRNEIQRRFKSPERYLASR